MTTLVVINGPPAVGKTTVGRELAVQYAPMLRLDVDEIRSLIVGWQEAPLDAGTQARKMVAEMAAIFLANDGNVVVSQLFGRPPDLERLEAVADQAGAKFVEVILIADREDVRQRFVARGGEKVDDLADFDRLYNRVLDVREQRPAAVEISSLPGQFETTLAHVAQAAGFDLR